MITNAQLDIWADYLERTVSEHWPYDITPEVTDLDIAHICYAATKELIIECRRLKTLIPGEQN